MIALALAGLPVAIWLYLLLGHGGFWRIGEREERLTAAAAPPSAGAESADPRFAESGGSELLRRSGEGSSTVASDQPPARTAAPSDLPLSGGRSNPSGSGALAPRATELPSIVANYAEWQHARHLVRPGITGWWQVNGRSDLPMHEHTDLDLYYVEHISPWLDLRIALRTLGVVARRGGAY